MMGRTVLSGGRRPVRPENNPVELDGHRFGLQSETEDDRLVVSPRLCDRPRGVGSYAQEGGELG